MSKPGGDPCMGLVKGAHLFRFFVPTRTSVTSARAGAVKVGRCTKLKACSVFARPYLDSFQHDAMLGPIGMTIRGESLSDAINRAAALYSVTARTRL